MVEKRVLFDLSMLKNALISKTVPSKNKIQINFDEKLYYVFNCLLAPTNNLDLSNQNVLYKTRLG